MIWLIGGTSEARELANKLASWPWAVVVTTTTKEGASLLQDSSVDVAVGQLRMEDMSELVRARGVEVVVDASHPFATVVSQQAMAVCQSLQVPYLRYERESLPLPSHPLVHEVDSMEEAAQAAFSLGRTVFTTIGVQGLPVFIQQKQSCSHRGEKRLVVKVLPVASSLGVCHDLGLKPTQIVALAGSIGSQLYQAICREYAADVIVTKESGLVGGVKTKLEACLALGLHLVVVRRPSVTYPLVMSDANQLICRIQQILHKRGR